MVFKSETHFSDPAGASHCNHYRRRTAVAASVLPDHKERSRTTSPGVLLLFDSPVPLQGPLVIPRPTI